MSDATNPGFGLRARVTPQFDAGAERSREMPEQWEYPSLEGLVAALLERAGISGRSSLRMEREANLYQSTATSEVITIIVDDLVVAQILCKSVSSIAEKLPRWRWGPEYEALVYRDILAQAGIAVPEYYGTWTDRYGVRHLAIRFIEGALRVNKAWPKASAMGPTASWLGRLHSRLEVQRLTSDQRALLKSHDQDYYEMWFTRARSFVEVASKSHTNLARFSRDSSHVIALLLSGPHSVIHGDFSPSNALVSEVGEVVVVDWESAAIGPSVIDIASLTEGWSQAVTADCVSLYSRSSEALLPADFHRHLAAARIYNYLRSDDLSPATLSAPRGLRRAQKLASALEEVLA